MSLRSTRSERSQTETQTESSKLQEALSTIQQLEQRVQKLTEMNEKLNESDKILQQNKLLKEKLRDAEKKSARWQQTAKDAKRDSEIRISNCKKREEELDKEVQKAAQRLFNEFRRPYEENIDKMKKEAQNERERLLEASEKEATAIRKEAEKNKETAIALKKRSILIVACCVVIGLISGISITNRLLDKAHVAKIAKQKAQIEELKATIEDKDKLLGAEYYIYNGLAWDTLTLKAKKGNEEVTFYGGECIRIVKNGGMNDYVVMYNGKKYIVEWTTFMSNFKKIQLP